MYDFYNKFEEYCKTPGIESGKARSYTKAIEYLCDYLKIQKITSQAIAQIKSLENNIYDKDSELYQDLLHFFGGAWTKVLFI